MNKILIVEDDLSIQALLKFGATLSELQEANKKLQTDIDMERHLERQHLFVCMFFYRRLSPRILFLFIQQGICIFMMSSCC